MKILVTGAAGFLGSHIVDRALADGHEVVGLDNMLTGSEENYQHNLPNANFCFFRADITDREYLDQLFSGQKFDAVIHTAAIARTPWTIEDPQLSHDVNATGTLNLLEAARKHGVKRFVHSSSCIVYVPNTPYYVSKLCAEEYVSLYRRLYGLSTISLRYQNLYGARQSEKPPHPNVFAAFRASKKQHGKILITGDGMQTRDFTHVSDAVEANMLALNCHANGWTDICFGVPVSLNEVVRYFNCPVEYIPEREGDVKHLLGKPDYAETLLGFKAKVALKIGIADVL